MSVYLNFIKLITCRFHLSREEQTFTNVDKQLTSYFYSIGIEYFYLQLRMLIQEKVPKIQLK